MNYTEKYHLPQWEEIDRIMRVDFNEAMANVEAGISNALDTANTAKSDAAEAARLPYVVGSYTSDGTDQDINLGFRPSFLIVCGLKEAGSAAPGDFSNYLVMTAGNVASSRIILTDSGFSVKVRSIDRYYFPDLAFNGRVYDYIAFR